MKLSKAIEILTDRSKDFIPGQDPDLRDATKLGIEALKSIDKLRDYEHHVYPTTMKGETPENEK